MRHHRVRQQDGLVKARFLFTVGIGGLALVPSRVQTDALDRDYPEG